MVLQRTLFVLIAALLPASVLLSQDGVTLNGRVVNENGVPLDGARLIFRPDSRPAEGKSAFTDPAGQYTITLPGPSVFLVDVERKGYFALQDTRLELGEGDNEADFTLNRIREVIESVDVSAAPPPINMETTETEETVTGRELNNVPYPTTNNLRNALRMMPAVTQGSNGRIHINGGKEEQALYTLNGFNITDPLTGRFESRVSLESVQTVEVASGLVSAEYGKGSAGVMAVNTKSGDDKFRATATNFFPGIETQGGIHVGNWTPRVNVSGPIKLGRAWFSNSTDAVYTNTVIDELPKGEDRSSNWRLGNHLTTQVNLTPSNVLHTGLLANVFLAPRYGLGVLDPRETTLDRRARQFFFHAKDQAYLPRQVLVEFGYAANRTYGRYIPQGREFYEFTPEGRAGNHFLDNTQRSSRHQVIGNVFLPPVQLLGEHRIKAGMDLNRLSYWQDANRTGFYNFGSDLVRTRQTVFVGSGVADLVNYEMAFYFQDSWKPKPGLLLELGLRGDWDQLLNYWSASPRFGVAWQPPGMERTKISGGYGVIYDATNLHVFSRPLDQRWLTTYFGDDGAPVRGPALTVFTITNPRPARPRYHNWNVGVEHELSRGIHARAEYLRKRGYLGFTYLNTLAAPGGPFDEIRERFDVEEFDAIYNLTNDRHDEYDHFRFTVRQTFKREYQWLLSYTRSRAYSNSVVDADIDDPIIVNQNVGPMPWDAPHRLVSWGYLPAPLQRWKKWSVSYLCEWHTGFPFSIVDDASRVIGEVNSNRFPDFFQLNLHLERRFEFKKHLWALRAGANNVTDNRNPTVVNNNTSSRNFLLFYGGADRSFNFRIRWLGKVAQ